MTYTAPDQGFLPETTLAAIADDIRERGFAVVSNLIPEEACQLLMASVLEDAAQARSESDETPHEKITGHGHLQLGLRRFAPYVRPELVANPIVEQIVARVLGDGAWLGFYSGNVNLPGSVHQPLHYDRPFSWRTREKAARDGQPWPPPTTTLSCSVALTDLTVENGATEIYPGTHVETAVTEWGMDERLSDHPELIERWGPAQRMVVPAGGICFRDPRMWHRGVPNPSSQARPMIALTYHGPRCKSWRGRLLKNLSPEDEAACDQNASLKVMDDGTLGDGRLVFEASARDAFGDDPCPHGVYRNVRFVDPPDRVDHFHDAHLLGGARVTQNSS